MGVGEDEHGDPDGYDQGVDMQMFRGVAERLEQRMPGMSQASFLRGWSGLFTITPDWHPILDKAGQIDGLYVAVGFSGHGFKLAPMIGVTMAELIVKRQGRLDRHIAAWHGPLRQRPARLGLATE